ncbi:MAG: 5-oxoprolinase subunit PxpA [Pseudomonadota bacterium]
MSKTIDLNADLGELPGKAGRASDRAILKYVTSCAIACGGHVGDAGTMEATLLAARDLGVSAGAHPSYPDGEGFGRRSIAIGSKELEKSIIEQMSNLKLIADRLDIPLTHVKPHGALYNDASKDEEIAETIVKSVHSVFGDGVAIICQPGFALQRAADRAGLKVLAEAFIDRAYQADGTLVPRTEPGAVLETGKARLNQARNIVLQKKVKLNQGESISLRADTLCLHGDSPGAAETAKLIREGLEADGVEIREASA